MAINMYLPSIKTFVYTIERHVDRQANILKMMDKLGFTNWSFVVGSVAKSPYWVNIHDDFVNILETPAPFLFLEDDVALTEHYAANIEYPEDSQLVYLGGSTHGENNDLTNISAPCIFSKGYRRCLGRMIYSERDDEYIQVYNMHSTHAILFVDDVAKNEYRSLIDLNREVITDNIFARNMHRFKTYCVKKPFWYQDDGHHHYTTLQYYEQPRPNFSMRRRVIGL